MSGSGPEFGVTMLAVLSDAEKAAVLDDLVVDDMHVRAAAEEAARVRLALGLLVDARTLPSELQNEARRRGLIPDLDIRRAA